MTIGNLMALLIVLPVLLLMLFCFIMFVVNKEFRKRTMEILK